MRYEHKTHVIGTAGWVSKGKIDPEMVDLDDIEELEGWVAEAVKEAINQSQQVAAEKMKPVMGQLGNLGL